MIPAREANDEGEYILRAIVTKPKNWNVCWQK